MHRCRLRQSVREPVPDGLPDLYCVHGANQGKPDGRQWRNELYLQRPNHTFPISSMNDALDARVVACGWGVCDMHGRGREAVALDFDRDGKMDIAVANDADVAGPDPTIGPWHGHDTPNRLFHNEGGRFREVTPTPVNQERASACVEAGDINGDGWIDLLFAPNQISPAMMVDRATMATECSPTSIEAANFTTLRGVPRMRQPIQCRSNFMMSIGISSAGPTLY